MGIPRQAPALAEEVADRMLAEREWPVTVRLKRPIEFGSERIEALVFREGCWGDIKDVRSDGIPTDEQLMKIASRMCAQPVAALEKLRAADIAEVKAIALGFFAESLGAGKTPSA